MGITLHGLHWHSTVRAWHGTSMSRHGNGTGTTQHGLGMARHGTAWARHGHGMGTAWARHGIGTAWAWARHGHGTAWAWHGMGMAWHGQGTGTARVRHMYGTCCECHYYDTSKALLIMPQMHHSIYSTEHAPTAACLCSQALKCWYMCCAGALLAPLLLRWRPSLFGVHGKGRAVLGPSRARTRGGQAHGAEPDGGVSDAGLVREKMRDNLENYIFKNTTHAHSPSLSTQVNTYYSNVYI